MSNKPKFVSGQLAWFNDNSKYPPAPVIIDSVDFKPYGMRYTVQHGVMHGGNVEEATLSPRTEPHECDDDARRVIRQQRLLNTEVL